MKYWHITLLSLLLLAAAGAGAAFGRWFKADLTGSQEVPAVSTSTTGKASVKFNREQTKADFRVNVHKGEAITAAHLHCAPASQNGPVVAHLFGNIPGGFNVNGKLADFTLTQANIVTNAGCSPAITTMAELAQALRDGRIYANVHSVSNPNGLIRGQLHE